MGIAGNLFYSTADKTNCLDWRVRPSDEQFGEQQERWNDLADHLRVDLARRSGCVIASWLQGSYKFGTQVRPAQRGHEFDIDLGIYFCWAGAPDDGDLGPGALKELVQESLEAYADDGSNDAEGVSEPKKRCNRIHFSGDFHIDVPAYHLDRDRDARALATDEDRWEESDPKAIYEWWKQNFDEANRPRARRMARYMKMWGGLNFDDPNRPSSILLTVLLADACRAVDLRMLKGDDEVVPAVAAEVIRRLQKSQLVANPVNAAENLNRLSNNGNEAFLDKLESLVFVGDRALAAPTKAASAEIWSEVFTHFFPGPDADDDVGSASEGRALVPVTFEPEVSVRATVGRRVFEGQNRIGPIPKGSDITFTLANAHLLPPGATIGWTVRNEGPEAERKNDLGHSRGDRPTATETSAYRGLHSMDVAIKLNGVLIGRKRVPVQITGLGTPLRNSPRPAWTKFRRRR